MSRKDTFKSFLIGEAESEATHSASNEAGAAVPVRGVVAGCHIAMQPAVPARGGTRMWCGGRIFRIRG
jgi:hypothetical protein